MTSELDLNSQHLAIIDKHFKNKHGKNFKGLVSQNKYDAVTKQPIICPSINEILKGGLPIGRIIEVFGQPSHGKTSVALHFIQSFQKEGKSALFIDAEHSFDPEYAEYCGVDMDKLFILEPKDAQEALDGIRSTCCLIDEETNNSIIPLVVLDSVAALVPTDEYTKDVGGGMVGSLARLMSSTLKQIVVLAAQHNCTIVLINQERSTNLMGYGPKTGTTGGVALQYYTSVRIDVTRTGFLEATKGGDKTGISVKLETVKNKTATPMKSTIIELVYPIERNNKMIAGVDLMADIVNSAIEKDLIQKKGSWFNYKDFKTQGLEKLKAKLMEDQDMYQEIYNQVTGE